MEGIAAFVGAALAMATLAILIWGGLGTNEPPPLVSVRALDVSGAEGNYVLRIEVVNDGGSTASAVEVEGVLGEGQEAETARATFDYVPRYSHARGGLFFKRDPRSANVRLRALGYADP